MRFYLAAPCVVCLGLVGRADVDAAKALEFQLTFTKQALDTPFTGRVFVVASKSPLKNAPPGIGWFNPPPFFAQEVKDWQPDTPLTFAPTAALPAPLAQLPAGKYHVQLVLDRDLGGRNCMSSPGNLFSKPVTIEHDPAKGGVVALTADQVVQPRKFEEKPRVKLVDIESKLLSAFHGRPMRLRAGVVLPRSYAENRARRYPVLYVIPGFGGTHFSALNVGQSRTMVGGVEMLYVVLDPSCRLGHHVFADSENNGPCGAALVTELIPHLEREFRALGEPTARFVTGHSSGGWSSLWLQVTYPGFFGGVWSTAPDPVDFRDFSGTNIYQPGANLFFDEKGQPRPIGRRGGKPAIFCKGFSDMEIVIGHGGQFGSFDAVFSPRGPEGKPRPLWDRKTGQIDPDVARYWERYDIRLVLERHWHQIGARLAGKLHVYMGAEDTFYLAGATALLKETLARLGSDAVVEIFPGRDHGNLIDARLRERIAQEMAEQFRRRHPASD
jgi:hypothetical protein